MIVTVFTPTYNRGYILPRLYGSLKNQISKDFEWVIVDDGSKDNTESIVDAWIKEGFINIRYFKQKNAGKPTAHNRGVSEAKGQLFTCVDSDDYLTEDAIYEIKKAWKTIGSKNYVGILAYRIHSNQIPITRLKNTELVSSTLHEAYKKHGLRGDTMLVFDIEVLRKYSFPRIGNEKFIPEGYLYNKIDSDGELYILRKGLYVCDYLEDGYTKNIDKLLFDNFKSYSFHIRERLTNMDKGFDKWLDSIRYTAILISHHERNIIRKSAYPIITALVYFPSWLIAKKRYGKYM